MTGHLLDHYPVTSNDLSPLKRSFKRISHIKRSYKKDLSIKRFKWVFQRWHFLQFFDRSDRLKYRLRLKNLAQMPHPVFQICYLPAPSSSSRWWWVTISPRKNRQRAPAPSTRWPSVIVGAPGGNCIKIGLPGKLILSRRKGLREVIFSWKYNLRIDFPGRPILYNWSLLRCDTRW